MYIGSCSLQKDWPHALEISEKGAKLGCNDCKAALASCLRLMCMDEERAVQMAMESASAGNAWGCSEMGLLLQYAIGVPQDIEQAVFYTRRAAALGNAWARHNLGVMHSTGFGVDKDYCEAARCEMRAAPSCCVQLALLTLPH
jgi:TPR repeat protein